MVDLELSEPCGLHQCLEHRATSKSIVRRRGVFLSRFLSFLPAFPSPYLRIQSGKFLKGTQRKDSCNERRDGARKPEGLRFPDTHRCSIGPGGFQRQAADCLRIRVRQKKFRSFVPLLPSFSSAFPYAFCQEDGLFPGECGAILPPSRAVCSVGIALYRPRERVNVWHCPIFVRPSSAWKPETT